MANRHKHCLTRNTILAVALLAAGVSARLVAAAPAAPAPATADSLAQAFEKGKVSLNVRARYETVEQTGLRDADATTLRTRLGFTTAPLAGFQAMVEGEHIGALDGDHYSQAGLNRAAAGRAVVPDPEGYEINQAWLSFKTGKTSATVGRQRLVYDNARFVGDVAWRQNMQTFDAISLQDKSIDKVTLNYAYIDQVNRVFGRDHAQGRWESDSHLFNASYTGLPGATLTGYAYALDFSNATAQSSLTYGASLAGSRKLNADFNALYRLEFALQTDYGSNRADFWTNYAAIEAGVGGKAGSLSLGYERLGSDNGQSFRTPLATLHAFNGWADLFLTTPTAGLRDTYVKGGLNLPEGFNLLAFYHQFKADTGGADLGTEFDIQLTRKFCNYVTGTVKWATFDPERALPKVNKVWLQIDFAY